MKEGLSVRQEQKKQKDHIETSGIPQKNIM